jgi:DivIVA domain-containing protein
MGSSYSASNPFGLHFQISFDRPDLRGQTMPLTPADVHNVAFSKPPIGKRGYNEDEVDAFLDLVEGELTRLIEENSDLRQRVAELEHELTGASSGAGASPTQAIPLYEPPPPAPQPEPQPAPQPAPRPVYEAPLAATPGLGEEEHMKAARVLALAQDTADRLTGTSKAEADKLLADARANAESIVAEARHTAETTVAEARQRADAMLSDAQMRSETQLRQAQEKADALQADAERKHSEIMGTINQQRTVLEGRLEQLRTFEREYRTRLKTYLESQLEELGQRGSAAPVDSSANSDTGAFNQFNRGNN